MLLPLSAAQKQLAALLLLLRMRLTGCTIRCPPFPASQEQLAAIADCLEQERFEVRV